MFFSIKCTHVQSVYYCMGADEVNRRVEILRRPLTVTEYVWHLLQIDLSFSLCSGNQAKGNLRRQTQIVGNWQRHIAQCYLQGGFINFTLIKQACGQENTGYLSQHQFAVTADSLCRILTPICVDWGKGHRAWSRVLEPLMAADEDITSFASSLEYWVNGFIYWGSKRFILA